MKPRPKAASRDTRYITVNVGLPSETVKSTASSGQIKIDLLAGERLVAEQTRQAGASPMRGGFASVGPISNPSRGDTLAPGVCALWATFTAPQQATQTARRQVIVAQSPFDWQKTQKGTPR